MIFAQESPTSSKPSSSHVSTEQEASPLGHAKISPDINSFLQSLESAWNAHNSNSLASLWTSNGDLITPWGRWIVGSLQIEKHFDKQKTGPLGKGKVELSLDSMRYLTAQLAVLDVTIKLSNILDPQGELPPNLLQHAVFILTKENDLWKIVSLRVYQFQPQQIE